MSERCPSRWENAGHLYSNREGRCFYCSRPAPAVTACTHRYENASDGLPCLLEAHPLTPNGHSYETSDGSSANDRHTDGGHG